MVVIMLFCLGKTTRSAERPISLGKRRVQRSDQSRLTARHMPGRCRTTAASGRCGRSSASRPTSHKVPCFRGSLSRICGFSGFLPPAVSGVIFRNRGFPTFLLGEYPRGAPDSHKLPRRIWENRRTSGNPGSSPALSTRHSSNPDFPCIHRRRQPPQHRQNLLPTLSSP